MDLSLVRPLADDELVVGLVALQLAGLARAVAHEALLALQHQHRPVHQVEEVSEGRDIGVRKELTIRDQESVFISRDGLKNVTSDFC